MGKVIQRVRDRDQELERRRWERRMEDARAAEALAMLEYFRFQCRAAMQTVVAAVCLGLFLWWAL